MNILAFFKPHYLWALLLVSIILLVHFLKRPRLIKLQFSTLRFFHENAIKSSKTRKLRNLLKLLIRIFIFTLVVFLFSRPFDPKNILNAFSNPQVSLYIWIDPTPSMGYKENLVSIEQKCYNFVDSLKNVLPSSAKIYVFDHKSKKFTYGENQYYLSMTDLQSIDLRQAFTEFEKEKKNRSNPVLIICSDFQTATVNSIDSISRQEKNEKQVVLIPFIPNDPWNYSVNNSEIENGTVKSTINAFGKNLENGKIVVNLDKMKYGENTITVEKNTQKSVSVRTGIRDEMESGVISLNTNDPLQFDNNDFFKAQIRDNYSILVIGNPEKNNVIGMALTACSRNRWNSVSLKSERNVLPEQIDSADIIIVNNLDGPSGILEKYFLSKNCKNKIFIVGIEASNDLVDNRYHKLLARVSTDMTSYSLRKPRDPVYPVLPDTFSEIWKKFPFLQVSETSINQYVNGINEQAFLTYNNGDPFIWYVKRSGAQWIIFSTSLGISSDNNLCETGFYIPMLDRIISYLINASSTQGNTWIAGTIFKNPYFGTNNKISIVTPDNKLMENINSSPTLSFGKTGIYKIISEKGITNYCKVQPDYNESKMEYIEPSSRSSIVSKCTVVSNNALLHSIRTANYSSMWLIGWILLPLLIILELVLRERPVKKIDNFLS